MTSNFSAHCTQRIAERTSMSQRDIAILLDGNKTVDVGFERGSQRLQRVFFSPLDQKCFMAVQDMKHGTVVTVIPVDGQGSVTHISYDVVAAARSIYEKCISSQESDTQESPLENGHISEKRVNALFYVADQQANVKVLNAKVVTHQKEGTHIRDLLMHGDFLHTMRCALREILARKTYAVNRVLSCYCQAEDESLVPVDETYFNILPDSQYTEVTC